MRRTIRTEAKHHRRSSAGSARALTSAGLSQNKAPVFAMRAAVMAAGHRFSIINFAISVAALS
jgi:hypothetical protein